MNERVPWLAGLAEKSHALAIGIFSLEGTVLYANQAMAIRLGDPPSVARLINPTFAGLVELTADGTPFEGIVTTGASRDVGRSDRARAWRQGAEITLVGEPDVAELDRMNRELAAMNREVNSLQRGLMKEREVLRRANADKDMFLGMAAHDLRNPLGAIEGYCRLLDSGVVTEPADRRRFLKDIQSIASGMLGLVNNLLDVSVIERGQLDLRVRPTDVRGFLDPMIWRARHVAERKVIALEVTLEPDLPMLDMDPERVEQVCQNLLSNATKFSERGTTVRLAVRRRNATPGPSRPTESVLRFEVVDQGPGIDPADQPRLFGAFQRTGAQPTGGESSTGLGLMICKRIVEAHGGRIGVESALGVGATFWFELPLRSSLTSSQLWDDVDVGGPCDRN